MTEKFKSSYEKFLDTWGLGIQAQMAVEEMGELIKAVCKYNRKKCFNELNEEIEYNLKEEIADVLNTVEQLELAFGVQEIEKIREQKIERTLKKI